MPNNLTDIRAAAAVHADRLDADIRNASSRQEKTRLVILALEARRLVALLDGEISSQAGPPSEIPSVFPAPQEALDLPTSIVETGHGFLPSHY